jgi:hypothetical protein
MKRSLGAATMIAVLAVAAALLFLALRPAHAQQWQLPNYGRDHGVVTEPGMPKCNTAVSEECRRLYGRAQRRGGQAPAGRGSVASNDPQYPAPLSTCVLRRLSNNRDPRYVRLTAETQRRGGSRAAAETLRTSSDFQSLRSELFRKCGLQP